MYNNSNYEKDQFNSIQNKIKETIDSMVVNNHISNTSNNSSSSNINDIHTNKLY